MSTLKKKNTNNRHTAPFPLVKKSESDVHLASCLVLPLHHSASGDKNKRKISVAASEVVVSVFSSFALLQLYKMTKMLHMLNNFQALMEQRGHIT